MIIIIISLSEWQSPCQIIWIDPLRASKSESRYTSGSALPLEIKMLAGHGQNLARNVPEAERDAIDTASKVSC